MIPWGIYPQPPPLLATIPGRPFAASDLEIPAKARKGRTSTTICSGLRSGNKRQHEVVWKSIGNVD
jgi:hypothetical protein